MRPRSGVSCVRYDMYIDIYNTSNLKGLGLCKSMKDGSIVILAMDLRCFMAGPSSLMYEPFKDGDENA